MSALGAPFEVDFRKWPDSGHWRFTVYPLGEDEFGRWFVLPRGSRVQRGDEPARVYPMTSALCLIEGAWSMPYWNSDPAHGPRVYVDVATPPRIEPTRVRLVDLDLDVICGWSGEVEIVDRDEFLLHQVAFAYPAELVARAEAEAQALVRAMERGDGPFGGAGEAWLRRALEALA